jgi:hypothetical protein
VSDLVTFANERFTHTYTSDLGHEYSPLSFAEMTPRVGG